MTYAAVRDRTSVGMVVFAIALSSIFLAALKSGTYSWYQTAYGTTIAVLTFAAIASRYRSAFYWGFAVAGWIYFTMGLHIGKQDQGYVGPSSHINTDFAPNIWIVKATYKFLPDAPPDNVQATTRENSTFPLQPKPGVSRFRRASQRSYTIGIAHCALALLAATLGGFVAITLAAPTRSRPPTPTP